MEGDRSSSSKSLVIVGQGAQSGKNLSSDYGIVQIYDGDEWTFSDYRYDFVDQSKMESLLKSWQFNDSLSSSARSSNEARSPYDGFEARSSNHSQPFELMDYFENSLPSRYETSSNDNRAGSDDRYEGCSNSVIDDVRIDDARSSGIIDESSSSRRNPSCSPGGTPYYYSNATYELRTASSTGEHRIENGTHMHLMPHAGSGSAGVISSPPKKVRIGITNGVPMNEGAPLTQQTTQQTQQKYRNTQQTTQQRASETQEDQKMSNTFCGKFIRIFATIRGFLSFMYFIVTYMPFVVKSIVIEVWDFGKLQVQMGYEYYLKEQFRDKVTYIWIFPIPKPPQIVRKKLNSVSRSFTRGINWICGFKSSKFDECNSPAMMILQARLAQLVLILKIVLHPRFWFQFTFTVSRTVFGLFWVSLCILPGAIGVVQYWVRRKVEAKYGKHSRNVLDIYFPQSWKVEEDGSVYHQQTNGNGYKKVLMFEEETGISTPAATPAATTPEDSASTTTPREVAFSSHRRSDHNHYSKKSIADSTSTGRKTANNKKTLTKNMSKVRNSVQNRETSIDNNKLPVVIIVPGGPFFLSHRSCSSLLAKHLSESDQVITIALDYRQALSLNRDSYAYKTIKNLMMKISQIGFHVSRVKKLSKSTEIPVESPTRASSAVVGNDCRNRSASKGPVACLARQVASYSYPIISYFSPISMVTSMFENTIISLVSYKSYFRIIMLTIFKIMGLLLYLCFSMILNPVFYSSILNPWNYKLSTFGEIVEDVVLGFRWVKQNISRYGGDVGSITVCGQSSGAYLSLLAFLRSPEDFKFQNFFGCSGIYDIPELQEYLTRSRGIPKELFEILLRATTNPEQNRNYRNTTTGLVVNSSTTTGSLLENHVENHLLLSSSNHLSYLSNDLSYRCNSSCNSSSKNNILLEQWSPLHLLGRHPLLFEKLPRKRIQFFHGLNDFISPPGQSIYIAELLRHRLRENHLSCRNLTQLESRRLDFSSNHDLFNRSPNNYESRFQNHERTEELYSTKRILSSTMLSESTGGTTMHTVNSNTSVQERREVTTFGKMGNNSMGNNMEGATMGTGMGNNMEGTFPELPLMKPSELQLGLKPRKVDLFLSDKYNTHTKSTLEGPMKGENTVAKQLLLLAGASKADVDALVFTHASFLQTSYALDLCSFFMPF